MPRVSNVRTCGTSLSSKVIVFQLHSKGHVAGCAAAPSAYAGGDVKQQQFLQRAQLALPNTGSRRGAGEWAAPDNKACGKEATEVVETHRRPKEAATQVT